LNTELVKFNSDVDFEQIASLTGAYIGNDNYLPQLRVNRLAVDNDGNQLPMGYFHVNQNNSNIYAKNALFRVFLNRYQYIKYDPFQDSYSCRSIIVSSFNEEALDDSGGLACGKIPKAKLEGVTDKDILEEQKNIRINRLLYGIVTLYDIKNSEDKVEIPVLYRLNGINFMAPDAALKAITKIKHHFFQHNLELKTKQEKRGSNIFYTVQVNPILNQVIPFTDSDLEVFKSFQEIIESENNQILQKWKKAKKSKVSDIELSLSSFSSSDLSDPLPF
jgi:hypothetical protein